MCAVGGLDFLLLTLFRRYVEWCAAHSPHFLHHRPQGELEGALRDRRYAATYALLPLDELQSGWWPQPVAAPAAPLLPSAPPLQHVDHSSSSSSESDQELQRPRKTTRRSRFQLFVKGLDGRTMTLQVSPLLTVLDLKQLIAQRGDLPPQLQRLVYAGRSLQDTDRVDEVLCPEATLHLVRNLRGC